MIIELINRDPRWQLRQLCDSYAPARRLTSLDFMRAAVALLEDLSVEEISRRTGVPASTILEWRDRL